MAERAQIEVKGVVQGVGFRPYVYALATGLGLAGSVSNTAEGVLIDAEGENLPEFLGRLRSEAPPLSRITQVSITKLPLRGLRGFTIGTSRESFSAFTLVAPDAATCPDCLRELFDPSDRRYGYPFINCTNCGPRYSITRCVPYDRPNTTMARFTMCPACGREYGDPHDRRFHAQPNACPACGPQVRFLARDPGGEQSGPPMEQCIEMMKNGGIVAIKGLGGFHLACDATNDASVRRLRERKRKSNKPFAVMCPDIAAVRRVAEAGEREAALMAQPARPIVLLRKRGAPVSGPGLSDAVSPNNRYVGCMLPYTPLHHLLFRLPGRNAAEFSALVMTSGNLAEEPLVRDNEEAVARLSGLADAFLFHDREIFMRVDDSVVRAVASGDRNEEKVERRSTTADVMVLRRSRGFAPDPIPLGSDGPEVLGCGADLKNTFTLTKGAFAIPSQHIGDMENYETLRFYEECLANLKQVYRAEPSAIVHDLHPGYLSSRWAREQGDAGKVALFAIQHHYAHIGAVMAEHGLSGPVLGVAFDGTGYGTDGHLWGGEFLVADIQGFERIGQIRYLPLPGGEAAIRDPWRTAVSVVLQADPGHVAERLEGLGFPGRYGRDEVSRVLRVAASEDLSPRSSGAGRLFDAVAALLGVCDRNTFEGEAAMALEALVREGNEGDYPVVVTRDSGYAEIDFSPAVRAIIRDLAGGLDRGDIATKFHNTFARVIVDMAEWVLRERGIADVALGGGTFQNLFLLRRATALLTGKGVRVYRNHLMPPNDACISLGQAYLVREQLKKR